MSYYVGLMSGTSMDGVDAALVDLHAQLPIIVAGYTSPMPAELRVKLERLSTPGDNELELLAGVDREVGELFARAALELLRQCGIRREQVRAIGSHGQTVRHYPGAGICQSIQAGDPNLIAEVTGITTVADLRRRDMAAGGEGAPLVPAFHRAVFQHESVSRAVVNIGGIANVTLLPAGGRGPVVGFDTGPGNTLLDAWVRECTGSPMDTGGSWAARGRVNEPLLSALLADPFFARPPPKSTGREHFNLDWLKGRLTSMERPPSSSDIQATLAALTAVSITHAIRGGLPEPFEVLVCGGGVHNGAVMSALDDSLAPYPVRSTASQGVDPDLVEAAAFAWLAYRTLEGLAGNVPEVTGAEHPVVLGGIYRA